MNLSSRIVAVALPVLAFFGPGPAAAVTMTETFYFNGICSDCSGVGHGTLVLANYTVGQSINSHNFVSFHYDGTNLASAFTIGNADLQIATGSMNGPMPATESIYLKSSDHYFYTQSNGNWSLGNGSTAQDVGASHSFTDVADVAEVPEPMSIAMLLSGIAATAMLNRRR